MKKELFIIGALIMLIAISIEAQNPKKTNWPFGKADTVGLASNDTISAVTVNITEEIRDNLSWSAATVDTAVTINATTIGARARLGAKWIFKFTGTEANEVVTWGTNLTGAASTVNAGKTFFVTFVYDGSGYVKYDENQAD